MCHEAGDMCGDGIFVNLHSADLAAGLRDTIGGPLLMAYTAVKRHEAQQFKFAPLARERQNLWHRY